jgi:hypothetical protein
MSRLFFLNVGTQIVNEAINLAIQYCLGVASFEICGGL